MIDTDWSTLAIDVGDNDLASRLPDLVQTAGLTPLAKTAQAHTWTERNPDEFPAPDGCFSMESLADDLVTANQLAPEELAAFVSTIRTAALRNQFSISLTMFAVIAATP